MEGNITNSYLVMKIKYMDPEKIKKIITVFVASAVISGGLIITFNQTKPLTPDEYTTLLQVYNYEIEKAGGQITLGTPEVPVTKDNMLKLLNEKLIANPVPDTVKIGEEILSKEDYLILRSGLFQKTKH